MIRVAIGAGPTGTAAASASTGRTGTRFAGSGVEQLLTGGGIALDELRPPLAERRGQFPGLDAQQQKVEASPKAQVLERPDGTAPALFEPGLQAPDLAHVGNVATLALEASGDVHVLSEMPYPGSGRSVSGELTDAIAKIGENMNLRRAAVVEVSDGVVGHYVHNSVKPGMGKLGVVVGVESTGDKAVLAALGKQLAMHITNTSPLSVSPDDLDPEIVARERAIFAEQAKESGKPAEIIEKMVEGRVRKYYEEVTLLAQTFIMDGETKVADVIKAAEKDAGAPIKVTKFVRFALGEGIAKEETDFAAEVAATARV